jgi:hypothetical protein
VKKLFSFLFVLVVISCKEAVHVVGDAGESVGKALIKPVVDRAADSQDRMAESLTKMQKEQSENLIKMQKEQAKLRGAPNSDPSTWDSTKDQFPPGFKPANKDTWKK